ncbi:hypothetical protein PZH33_22765, partial [Blautia schinkii]|uniref:hypothetical protein n=1 Tax=Blautia schinkii TaxID=180164 RepID=UPI0023B0006D
MKEGASTGMPVRESLLNDTLFAERPDNKAAWEAIQVGAKMRPAIPEFSEIMEISMTALSDEYVHVQVEDCKEIVERTVMEGEPVSRLFYRDHD